MPVKPRFQKKNMITLKLDDDMRDAVETLAHNGNVTPQQICRELVRNALAGDPLPATFAERCKYAQTQIRLYGYTRLGQSIKKIMAEIDVIKAKLEAGEEVDVYDFLHVVEEE